jgi:hypothetical protein
MSAVPLSEFDFGQEIVILTEKHSPEFSGTVEQAIIGPAGGAVFLRRDHVDPAKAQPVGTARLTWTSM